MVNVSESKKGHCRYSSYLSGKVQSFLFGERGTVAGRPEMIAN